VGNNISERPHLAPGHLRVRTPICLAQMPYKLSDLKQAHGDGVLVDNVCQKKTESSPNRSNAASIYPQ
jgi:hypothetical protein